MSTRQQQKQQQRMLRANTNTMTGRSKTKPKSLPPLLPPLTGQSRPACLAAWLSYSNTHSAQLLLLLLWQAALPLYAAKRISISNVDLRSATATTNTARAAFAVTVNVAVAVAGCLTGCPTD